MVTDLLYFIAFGCIWCVCIGAKDLSMNDCGGTFRGKFHRVHCLIWTIGLVQQGFFRLQIPKMDHLGVATPRNKKCPWFWNKKLWIAGATFSRSLKFSWEILCGWCRFGDPKDWEMSRRQVVHCVKSPVKSKILAMESRQHSSVVTNNDIFSWLWTGRRTSNSCEITCILHVSYICMLLGPCILQRFKISPPSRPNETRTSAKSPLSHLH